MLASHLSYSIGAERVSGIAKFVYFIVALAVMACMGVASVMMAEGRAVPATVLFIISIGGIGTGFALKKRFMRNG